MMKSWHVELADLANGVKQGISLKAQTVESAVKKAKKAVRLPDVVKAYRIGK